MSIKKIKETLNQEVVIIDKIPYYLSLFFIIFLPILIIINLFTQFYPTLNYTLILLILFSVILINRIFSKSGLKQEKFALSLIIIFLIIDLIYIIEKSIVKLAPGESIYFLPYRLYYLILILDIIIFAFNNNPIGKWLRSWLIKFKDPRAFIVLALIFLTLCPFFLFYKFEPIAEKSANIAYLFLVIGVFGQFILYLKQNKNKKDV